ncbi:hypothetical protein [Bacillus fonticola]|uniref:hypothetical protein n=1 Tax=Bacillus fonticola TaxID=2728853 RepID=UPI001475AE2B|nr:hypothetical protein [Bacillus fonticola]
MNVTPEMEKGFRATHGVGYELYARKHEVRMKVEQERQQEYEQSQRLIADLGRRGQTLL